MPEDVNRHSRMPRFVEPRATEHIPEMRTLIERLVRGGFAYVAEEHVLFSPRAMNETRSGLPLYGALANRTLDEMIAGARVDVAPYKRDAMDFVLWKPSKPGEPSWKSPAGIKSPGRPGWHIECSAMAWKHLGKQFDIHGGGIDLVFPHHENEIAQTCCAFHQERMANYWLHNGFLQVESEKMSKSLGNFVTIRELLADWPGDVLRLTMLKTHYRQPIDWRKDELMRSQSELRSWSDLIANMALEPSYESPDYSLIDDALLEALCDDLNTPLAFSKLHELADQARKDRSKGPRFAANAEFLGFTNLNRPGFFTSVIAAYVPPEKQNLFAGAQQLITNFKNYTANNFSISASSSSAELQNLGIHAEIGGFGQVVVTFVDSVSEPFEVRVQRLIAERNEARRRKDFTRSDQIRLELAGMGVLLKDTKDAHGNPVTTWEFAR